MIVLLREKITFPRRTFEAPKNNEYLHGKDTIIGRVLNSSICNSRALTGLPG